jgi:hypothetical protein
VKAIILAAMITLALTTAFVGASFFSNSVLADNALSKGK